MQRDRDIQFTGWQEKFVRSFIISEFYIFDLMKEPTFDFQGQFFFFTLYSTRRQGETFPRNYRLEFISSFSEKWPKSFLGCVRLNSDFMILDAWMSILRNFRIRFR